MPLDKVLIRHIEEMDEIENEIEEEIDGMISKLSINDIMADPENALLTFSASVQDLLKEKYYPLAAEKGIVIAKDIEKDGDIQIPKSDDPKLNEDLLDENEGEI